MQILKVISLLLDYPEEALRSAHKELDEAICSAREISPDQRGSLLRLLDELAGDELMDVQERYTELFDRGRALSLLLFEHVHGESRDRGQAMVDLMAQYEQHGLQLLGAGEIHLVPDCGIGSLGGSIHPCGEALAQLLQTILVDSNTRMLHDLKCSGHSELQIKERRVLTLLVQLINECISKGQQYCCTIDVDVGAVVAPQTGQHTGGLSNRDIHPEVAHGEVVQIVFSLVRM